MQNSIGMESDTRHGADEVFFGSPTLMHKSLVRQRCTDSTDSFPVCTNNCFNYLILGPDSTLSRRPNCWGSGRGDLASI